MNTMTREFDIIVYGASGFASSFIISKLMTHNIKLGLSGRNSERILTNIQHLSYANDLQIFEANPSDIDCVTSKTRILINCAGPYIHSGEAIVESCVRNKTHYIDISGETYFIERCIKKYHEKALAAGVFIINCCGFDSLPADIGVQYLKQYIKANNVDKICNNVEIESVLCLNNCFINKTTYNSAVYGFGLAKDTKKLRSDQSSNKNEKIKFEKNKLKKLFYDKELKKYCTIFPGTDASVVRKSQLLFRERMNDVNCRYYAYLKLGSLLFTMFVSFVGAIFYFYSLSSVGRYFLIKFSYLFTFGYIKNRRPKHDEIEKGTFKFLFRSDFSNKNYQLVLAGPDPGYITTSICVSEAAVLLIEMLDGQNEDHGVNIFKGGVLTPACVFHGSDIVERLKLNGITFELSNKLK